MSYFPTLSCVALMKIFPKPYSVLIYTNYKGYKMCRIYLYNFTQLGSSYAWKSQEYYIHQKLFKVVVELLLATRLASKVLKKTPPT